VNTSSNYVENNFFKVFHLFGFVVGALDNWVASQACDTTMIVLVSRHADVSFFTPVSVLKRRKKKIIYNSQSFPELRR
jgi:hypothetical protein